VNKTLIDYPSRRSSGVVSREFDVDDGVIVVDVRSQIAHRLEPLAASIWDLCDGHHSVADIATLVRSSVEVVESAVAELSAIDLLQKVDVHTRRTLMSRGAKIGAGLAVAAPLIESLVLPGAALATSGGNTLVLTNPASEVFDYSINGATPAVFTYNTSYYLTGSNRAYTFTTTAPGPGVAYISVSTARDGSSVTMALVTVNNESGLAITVNGVAQANGTTVGTYVIAIGTGAASTITIGF
jgi:hypothetical protein